MLLTGLVVCSARRSGREATAGTILSLRDDVRVKAVRGEDRRSWHCQQMCEAWVEEVERSMACCSATLFPDVNVNVAFLPHVEKLGKRDVQ